MNDAISSNRAQRLLIVVVWLLSAVFAVGAGVQYERLSVERGIDGDVKVVGHGMALFGMRLGPAPDFSEKPRDYAVLRYDVWRFYGFVHASERMETCG